MNRKINDEWFIIDNLYENITFIIVFIGEIVVQILLVEFGSITFNTSSAGLTGNQWGICIGFAIIGIAVNFIVRALPIHDYICPQKPPQPVILDVMIPIPQKEGDLRRSISAIRKIDSKLNFGKRGSKGMIFNENIGVVKPKSTFLQEILRGSISRFNYNFSFINKLRPNTEFNSVILNK